MNIIAIAKVFNINMELNKILALHFNLKGCVCILFPKHDWFA